MANDLEMRAEFDRWLRSLDGPKGDEPGYPASHELNYPDQRNAAWLGWQAALSRPQPSDAGDARDAARWRFVESELKRVIWTGSHYQYTIYLASPNREIEDPGAMVDAALAARQASLQPLEAGKVEPSRFQWTCVMGCGPCGVKRIEFEYLRTEDGQGNLLNSETIPRLVSQCCGAGLVMWDDERDEEMDVDVEPFISTDAIRAAIHAPTGGTQAGEAHESFAEKYKADPADPAMSEELKHFMNGWAAATKEPKNG